MAQQQSVLGIFGLTPEMYSQRRQDELEAEQLAVGRMSSGPGSLLSPSMSNIYGLATQQGQMIGQGVKGLLGVEDPQMQMVRDVQAMRSQFDVSTPKGLREFAAALSPKYPELAIQAAAKAADIDKDIAAAQKARREAIPTPQNAAEASKLNALLAKYPDTLEGRAQAADDFAEWKSGFKQKEAAAGVVKTSGNISGTIRDYQLTVKPYTDTIDASETVVNLLNEAQAKNNPTAYEGARVQLARAVGNSSLSRKDIEAAGGDPSIAGKILDTTSVLFTGVPSTDTLRDIARAANIVKKAAQMKKDTLTMQQRDIAEKEFNFTPEQLDRQFPLSPKTTKPTAASKTAQQAPIYATNPATKQRIMSTDGGNTWHPVGGQ